VLVSCTLVTTLYATTLTIANVSLPQIQGAMSATPDQIAWVITANLIATAVSIPAAGWMSKRFGRKRAILGGVAGFAGASLMCGLSGSLEQLVFWRVVQSACGSPLTPISQSLVLDQFQGRSRGPAIAFYGLGVTLGPTLAPLAGGYVSEIWGWPWVFFILIPLALIAFVGMNFCVRDADRGDADARLDWTGFLSLAVTVSCIQLVLDRGTRNEWLTSPEIIAEMFLAAAALWVFVIHSFTSKTPFLDLGLFKERNFCLGMGIGLIFGMLFITPTVLLPAALQQLHGVPDFSIGMMIAFRGGGTVISQCLMMVVSSRFDPRVLMLFGFAAHTLAGLSMAEFDINLSLWDVAWTSALQGFGVGFLWTPITLVLFSNLPEHRTAEGAGMFHFLRSVGSSYFISASFVVVFYSTNLNYADLIGNLSAFSEALRLPWVRGSWDYESTAGLAQLSHEAARQAMMIGFVNSFYLFTWVSLAVFPLIFMVRWPPGPAKGAG
jgi:DHA2 family multidrug resistance protein